MSIYIITRSLCDGLRSKMLKFGNPAGTFLRSVLFSWKKERNSRLTQIIFDVSKILKQTQFHVSLPFSSFILGNKKMFNSVTDDFPLTFSLPSPSCPSTEKTNDPSYYVRASFLNVNAIFFSASHWESTFWICDDGKKVSVRGNNNRTSRWARARKWANGLLAINLDRSGRFFLKHLTYLYTQGRKTRAVLTCNVYYLFMCVYTRRSNLTSANTTSFRVWKEVFSNHGDGWRLF